MPPVMLPLAPMEPEPPWMPPRGLRVDDVAWSETRENLRSSESGVGWWYCCWSGGCCCIGGWEDWRLREYGCWVGAYCGAWRGRTNETFARLPSAAAAAAMLSSASRTPVGVGTDTGADVSTGAGDCIWLMDGTVLAVPTVNGGNGVIIGWGCEWYWCNFGRGGNCWDPVSLAIRLAPGPPPTPAAIAALNTASTAADDDPTLWPWLWLYA